MLQKFPKGNKTPWNVWLAFCRSWPRVFGPPEILVVDEGKEFMGTFADRAGEEGCLVSTIDARAPWKNAKTERAGGHFKAIYAKARELEAPETKQEAEAL
eukprot:3679053-Pyramimonas_sp.AAC.1